MRKLTLPKRLTKYYQPETALETLCLNVLWAEFRKRVRDPEWERHTEEARRAYCEYVLGLHFRIPESEWPKFTKVRQRSFKSKAESFFRLAAKYKGRFLIEKPAKKRKKSKPKKPASVPAKGNPAVILRKG